MIRKLLILVCLSITPAGCNFSTSPIATHPTGEVATVSSAPVSPTAEPALIVPPTDNSPGITSISPLENGKLRLVYIVEGNLWLLDEGKEPVLLMESGDVNQAMLSLNGTEVIITRTRDINNVEIWILNSLGWRELSGKTFTGNIQFISFSDDGQLISLFRLLDPGQEIWVGDLGNASVHRLAGRETLQEQAGSLGVSFTQVAWIPHSHRLTYVTYNKPAGGDSSPPHDLVQMVDADTSEQSILFSTGQGGNITYSPDGTMMIVANESGVKISGIESLSSSQSVADYMPVCGTDCFIPQPAWSADSDFFLLGLPSKKMNPDEFLNGVAQPFTIWKISAHGVTKTMLGEFPVLPRVPGLFSFSPDLKRVAYTRDTRNLHIANLDGSDDFGYGSGVEFLGWAPDSLHFAFRSVSGQLMEGHLLGNVIPMIDASDVQFLGWIDATRFLLSRGSSQNWSLDLGTVGGESTRLVEFGASMLYDYVIFP